MYNKHLLHCMVEVSLGFGHSPPQEETPLRLCPSSEHNRGRFTKTDVKTMQQNMEQKKGKCSRVKLRRFICYIFALIL